jgi:hypothetical protein
MLVLAPGGCEGSAVVETCVVRGLPGSPGEAGQPIRAVASARSASNTGVLTGWAAR